MEKVAVFYGSSTGNTESAAMQIAKLLDGDFFNVADNPVEQLSEYNNLIFGTSTWGVGDLQDDWDLFTSKLTDANLNNKVIALFGLGDGISFADRFVDGMGIIYKTIKDKGCKVIGSVDSAGYDFDDSVALVDGKFVGLPLDEDNESNLTKKRIESWVELIRKDLL